MTVSTSDAMAVPENLAPKASKPVAASVLTTLHDRLIPFLHQIYPQHDAEELLQKLQLVVGAHLQPDLRPEPQRWGADTMLLITYGDSLRAAGEPPLQTLKQFLQEQLAGLIDTVHILPFFPYSSDHGFAVIDYAQVNPELGDWQDVTAIAQEFSLMADLVINHVSSQSTWFQQFLQQTAPGKDYFIETDPTLDYSKVTRPRSSPLCTPVETSNGLRHVWTTFSADQVDLNFANPAVLLEFVDILLTYCQRGSRWVRLDAVGYLWKKLGTPCIHLPETHAVVRMLRIILSLTYPDAVLLTETNVPNRENLSYFGNCNEAHVIYNFSLPPLVLNALLRGEAHHLKTWMMSMPPAPQGCAYLNFTASHDGIGLRPAEGLLDDEEYQMLLSTVQGFGAHISYRSHPDGRETPYEINISLFDALQGTINGPDEWQRQRFVCSQAIMMSVEGIPAFYIHSLLATRNDEARVEATGAKRAINRHQWNYPDLCQKLADPTSDQAWVLGELRRLIEVRKQQSAFHPDATQFTLHLVNPSVFGIWRQSRNRRQSLFCLHNLSDRPQPVLLAGLNLITTDDWYDLLSDYCFAEGEEILMMAPYQTIWLSNRSAF